jgi:hypothetical protein
VSTKSKALPPDVVAGQVWRDSSGQHFYVESAAGQTATLQRCTPAGRVLNARYRVNRTADQLREGFVLVVCARNRCTNKTAPFASWLGANRSDTEWYREDSQRRHGANGTVLCAAISGADH